MTEWRKDEILEIVKWRRQAIFLFWLYLIVTVFFLFQGTPWYKASQVVLVLFSAIHLYIGYLYYRFAKALRYSYAWGFSVLCVFGNLNLITLLVLIKKGKDIMMTTGKIDVLQTPPKKISMWKWVLTVLLFPVMLLGGYSLYMSNVHSEEFQMSKDNMSVVKIETKTIQETVEGEMVLIAKEYPDLLFYLETKPAPNASLEDQPIKVGMPLLLAVEKAEFDTATQSKDKERRVASVYGIVGPDEKVIVDLQQSIDTSNDSMQKGKAVWTVLFGLSALWMFYFAFIVFPSSRKQK